MSTYSVFGPRGTTITSTSAQSFAASYDFLPPQEDQEAYHIISGGRRGMDLENLYPPKTPDTGADVNKKLQKKQQRQQQHQKRQREREQSRVHQPQREDGDAEETEEEKVRQASFEILPLILSNPPSIPNTLKSFELNQRHSLLLISPHDLDDYLVTDGPTTHSSTSTKVIHALEQLKGHIEQLAGIYATDQDALASLVQHVQWQSPESDRLLAAIDVGHGGSREGLLTMILKREDSYNKAGWKFHNLLPFGAAPGRWHSSLEAAREQDREQQHHHQQPTQKPRQFADELHHLPLPQQEESDSQIRSRSATSVDTSKTAASYATADEGNNDEVENGPADRAQHLFTNPNDFWGGWENKENETGREETATSVKDDRDDAGDDNDDDYWNSYEVQDPYDESEKRRQEAMEREQQEELDTVSQIGSVNFEGLEMRTVANDSGRNSSEQQRPSYRTMRSVNSAASVERPDAVEERASSSTLTSRRSRSETQSGRRESQAVATQPINSLLPEHAQHLGDVVDGPTYADYPGVLSSYERQTAQDGEGGRDTHPLQGHLTLRAPAPPSPRSDTSDLGGTDEAENTTLYQTTVEGTEDGQLSLAAKTSGDAVTRRQTSTNGIAEGKMSEEEQQQQQEAQSDADRDSQDGDDTNSTVVTAKPEDDGQEQDVYYPPAPLSVSGQTVFETPADMSLAELEAFYRDRDHQRLIETRERLHRMTLQRAGTDDDSDNDDDVEDDGGADQDQHRSRRRDATQDDGNDESDAEVTSVLNEARSAIGDVIPDYSGLPGLGPTKVLHKKKTTRSDVLHRSGGDADALTALAQVDPNVGLDLDSQEKAKDRARVPYTRQVSMGTLRRLADQNQLSGPGTSTKGKVVQGKVAGHGSDDTSSVTSALTKGGGFKSFLQLAPSTVVTDMAELDEPDDSKSDAPETPKIIDEEDEGQDGDDEQEQTTEQESPGLPQQAPLQSERGDDDLAAAGGADIEPSYKSDRSGITDADEARSDIIVMDRSVEQGGGGLPADERFADHQLQEQGATDADDAPSDVPSNETDNGEDDPDQSSGPKDQVKDDVPESNPSDQSDPGEEKLNEEEEQFANAAAGIDQPSVQVFQRPLLQTVTSAADAGSEESKAAELASRETAAGLAVQTSEAGSQSEDERSNGEEQHEPVYHSSQNGNESEQDDDGNYHGNHRDGVEPGSSSAYDKAALSSSGRDVTRTPRQADFDFDAFMFPKEHKRNTHLDSPGLSDSDPMTRQAFSVITGRSGHEDSRSVNPSESFLPGAASDASVRPLRGSVVHRIRNGEVMDEDGSGILKEEEEEEEEEDDDDDDEVAEDEPQSDVDGNNGDDDEDDHDEEEEEDEDDGVNRAHEAGLSRLAPSSRFISTPSPPPLPSRPTRGFERSKPAPEEQSNDISGEGFGSTTTELGIAELPDTTSTSQSVGGGPSVAPGPHWKGHTAPPGSTSQHTAELRHQYLRSQRQQALAAQRNRMQQQKQQQLERRQQQQAALQKRQEADRLREEKEAEERRREEEQSDHQQQQDEEDEEDENDEDTEGSDSDGVNAGVDPASNDDLQGEDNNGDDDLDASEAPSEPARSPRHDLSDRPTRDAGVAQSDGGAGPSSPLPKMNKKRPSNMRNQTMSDMPAVRDRSSQGSDRRRGGEPDERTQDQSLYPRDVDEEDDSRRPASNTAVEEAEEGEQEKRVSDSAVAKGRSHQALAREQSRAGVPRHHFADRKQEARHQAGEAAARRREILRMSARRNEQARALLRSLVEIIQDGGAPMAESDFLRLAREAFREATRDEEQGGADGSLLGTAESADERGLTVEHSKGGSSGAGSGRKADGLNGRHRRPSLTERQVSGESSNLL